MSWIGGKKALRELIVRLFPLYYERYIEVFGGGGWVLFHKPPGNDFEVYNDFNGLLVNLYRCVRDKPEELMEALRYVLNAREDFDRIRSALARDSPASDVQRAAWFYQLIRYSYASGLTSFGSQPHDMRSNFSLIEQAHRRLAKVVIENKDFEKLLHQYDRPVSFFYLDPPYHATEGYYQNIGEDGFTEADHIRLRDALMRIEGKFLLSYNDDAFVRGLYDRPGMDFTEGVFRRITSKPKSIRSEVNESTRRKKKSFLRREIEETQTILRMTGRAAKFPMVCALSLLLFLVGAAFALTLGNLFLVPVLAVGMMFVPFWFIRLTANHYKKNIAAELETALSIITTAYLRNEDIQTAVEENIDYLNPPVRSVFVEFLTRIKLVDPDVDAALQDMGTKIDNAVFREWVAALLTCRHDRGLKTILTPIVAKLSDMRIVNGELENLVFEPRKEFITMQVLVIGNIPLLYWLNQDWYDVLMHTPLGQALLAAIAAVMFISTAAVIKLTQPIEYRR